MPRNKKGKSAVSKKKKGKPVLPRPNQTVQVAIKNVAVVIGNARMTHQEHHQLTQNLILITERCQLADELERQVNKGAKDEDSVSA